jgi:hypothetical protein
MVDKGMPHPGKGGTNRPIHDKPSPSTPPKTPPPPPSKSQPPPPKSK